MNAGFYIDKSLGEMKPCIQSHGLDLALDWEGSLDDRMERVWVLVDREGRQTPVIEHENWLGEGRYLLLFRAAGGFKKFKPVRELLATLGVEEFCGAPSEKPRLRDGFLAWYRYRHFVKHFGEPGLLLEGE